MKKPVSFSGLLLLLIAGISLNASVKANKPNPYEGSRITTVVIDPGHGGKDYGATFGNAREKDIVLDIARKLGNYISLEFPEIKVIYTRDRDIFVPLFRRADIANKNKADLFISIHVNSVKRGMAQGTETFTLGQHRTQENLEVAKKENSVILLENDYSATYEGFDPNSPESYIMFELLQDEYMEQSVMLASYIQNQFREKAKRIDRSVKQAGFLVLRRTTMPGVLVETGFLSHPSERRFLMTDTGRDYLASAIFRAFRDYKKNIEQKSSFQISTVANEDEQKTVPATPESHAELLIPAPVKTGSLYFSVQIAAFKEPKEIKPENFKNEKDIFGKNKGDVYCYFSGKFSTYEQAIQEKNRLKSKFSEAFIVAFQNNELISLKKH